MSRTYSSFEPPIEAVTQCIYVPANQSIVSALVFFCCYNRTVTSLVRWQSPNACQCCLLKKPWYLEKKVICGEIQTLPGSMKAGTFDANFWANFKRNIFLKFLQSEILSQPQIFRWFVQMLFSGPSLMLLNVVLLQWGIHDTTLRWMFGTSLEISITKSSIVLNLDDLYRLKIYGN